MGDCRLLLAGEAECGLARQGSVERRAPKVGLLVLSRVAEGL